MENSTHLIAGRLCLDFANSGTFPATEPPETLSWEQLIGFLEASRIVTRDRGEEMLLLTQAHPQAAYTLLAQANRLRDALRLVFHAMSRGKRAPLEWIQPINAVLRVTEGHDEITWGGTGWRIEFVAREEGLEWLLAAIARSAAELLTQGGASRLRECANPACSLLFYDDSRTRKRRWCTMALCGNRSKVAAFAKRRSAGA